VGYFITVFLEITAKSVGERILKIGQYFVKVRGKKMQWFHFSGHGVYNFRPQLQGTGSRSKCSCEES